MPTTLRLMTLLAGLLGPLCLAQEAAPPRQYKTAEDYRTVWQTDPGNALSWTVEMCHELVAQGNLDQARVLVAEAWNWTFEGKAGCWRDRDELASSLAIAAERAGRWDLAAEGYRLWALGTCRRFAYFYVDPRPRRAAYLGELAEAAYERAGITGPARDEVRRAAAEALASDRKDQPGLFNSVGPEWGDRLAEIYALVETAQDAEAVAAITELVQEIARDPGHQGAGNVMRQLGCMLWLPDSEAFAQQLADIAIESGDTNALEGLLYGCVFTWGGSEDAIIDLYRRCWGPWLAGATTRSCVGALMSEKLAIMGQIAEAHALAAETCNQAERVWQYGEFYGALCVNSTMPDALRLRCTAMTLYGIDTGERPREPADLLVGVAWGRAPEGEGERWCLETAQQALEAMACYREPLRQALAAESAAKLFSRAGREDLAAPARALAEALRAKEPKSVLQAGIAAAQTAAAVGRWEDVLGALGPLVQGHQPGVPVLQAMLLLQQACTALNRPEEAEAWAQAAWQVVQAAGLPDTERANYLVAMADCAALPDRKTFLLQGALQAAQRSGLDLLVRQVGRKLANVSLDAGDLETAREALLDVVDDVEAQRDQLAFDRELRQRWFADNIGPYRQLLRVAALQGDGELALSCSERMRARALQNELAWQKVDLGVQLPPEMQERLEALSAARREAYEQLQWALGGAAPPGEGQGEDTRGRYMPIRGSYMPIRGPYMPIRGPLEGDARPTAEDITRLREHLAALARDEAALESAIREAVPAYAAAGEMPIATAEELTSVLAEQPDLAVLQYTLCDRGVAVVALCAGAEPQVAFIQEGGEGLWERIGRFRESVWERRDDTQSQGAELYNLLLAPVEEAIGGARRLWVIADGALQLLPFSALVDPDGFYVGARAAVATAPSLSLALAGRGRRPQPANSALVIAAPDTGATRIGAVSAADPDDERGRYMPIRGMYMPVRGAYMPIRGEGNVSGALTAMARVPLPGAEAEGHAIAGRIPGSAILTGREATKAALLQMGADCDILHIATHGFADPDYPDFSGLLLAGTGNRPYDTLTAQEVYLWSLNARLVTLSACQTALGRDVQGEGLLGLPRAFIFAGAQDVLCSLWPVSDESTKVLMAWLYAALEQGATVEEALQQAQRVLMEAEATSHPFFWAGFEAVRGPE